jgi:hypothetical protein
VTHVYFWKNNPLRAARKGQPCKVLVRGKMGSVLIEFEDGFKMCTGRYSIRPIRK